MAETKVLVKLKGVPASVLSKLVEKGYYSTKSEALRAGVVRLGQDFGIVSPTEEAWMRMQSEIRRTGKRLPAQKVLRELDESRLLLERVPRLSQLFKFMGRARGAALLLEDRGSETQGDSERLSELFPS